MTLAIILFSFYCSRYKCHFCKSYIQISQYYLLLTSLVIFQQTAVLFQLTSNRTKAATLAHNFFYYEYLNASFIIFRKHKCKE